MTLATKEEQKKAIVKNTEVPEEKGTSDNIIVKKVSEISPNKDFINLADKFILDESMFENGINYKTFNLFFISFSLFLKEILDIYEDIKKWNKNNNILKYITDNTYENKTLIKYLDYIKYITSLFIEKRGNGANLYLNMNEQNKKIIDKITSLNSKVDIIRTLIKTTSKNINILNKKLKDKENKDDIIIKTTRMYLNNMYKAFFDINTENLELLSLLKEASENYNIWISNFAKKNNFEVIEKNGNVEMLIPVIWRLGLYIMYLNITKNKFLVYNLTSKKNWYHIFGNGVFCSWNYYSLIKKAILEKNEGAFSLFLEVLTKAITIDDGAHHLAKPQDFEAWEKGVYPIFKEIVNKIKTAMEYKEKWNKTLMQKNLKEASEKIDEVKKRLKKVKNIYEVKKKEVKNRLTSFASPEAIASLKKIYVALDKFIDFEASEMNLEFLMKISV